MSFETLRSHLNSILKGPNWNAVLAALAKGDEYLADTARKAFYQMFMSSAGGTFLDRLASNVGLGKPANVGLGDDRFRDLVLSVTNNKVNLEAVKKILAVFYGEESTRAHATSVSGPFALSGGDTLILEVDGMRVEIPFSIPDFRSIGAATADEVAAVITRHLALRGSRGYAVGRDGKVVVFSGAFGLGGSVQIKGGRAQNVFLFPARLAPDANLSGLWIIHERPNNEMLLSNYGLQVYTTLNLGDIINVYGDQFYPENRGAFEVIGWDGSAPVVRNPNAKSQNISNVVSGAVHLYRPAFNTIYTLPQYSLAAPTVNSLEVLLPASVQAVERDENSATYLGEWGEYLIDSAARSGGFLTIKTKVPHDLVVGGTVLVEGVYPIAGGGREGLLLASTTTEIAPREHHVAALLNDGNAIVVGGEEDGSNRMDLWLYEAQRERWTLLGSPANSYTHATATTLTDGRVLVAGAVSGGAVINELYDPTSQSLIRTGNFVGITSPGALASCLMADGKVFVYPGPLARDPESYDPATGLFTQIPGRVRGGTSKSRTYVSTTTLLDGRILIAGTDEPELYNPTTGVFLRLSGQIRGEHHAALVPTLGADGKVLLVGGDPTVPGVLPGGFLFDPATLTFEQIDELVHLREETEGVVSLGNGKVLIPRSLEPAPLPPDPTPDPVYPGERTANLWAYWEMEEKETDGLVDTAGWTPLTKTIPNVIPSRLSVIGNGRFLDWAGPDLEGVLLGTSAFHGVSYEWDDPFQYTVCLSFFFTPEDMGTNNTTKIIEIYDATRVKPEVQSYIKVTMQGVDADRKLIASYIDMDGIEQQLIASGPFTKGEPIHVGVYIDREWGTDNTQSCDLYINNSLVDSKSSVPYILQGKPDDEGLVNIAVDIGGNGRSSYTLDNVLVQNVNVDFLRMMPRKLPTTNPPDPTYIAKWEMDEPGKYDNINDDTKVTDLLDWDALTSVPGVIGTARYFEATSYGSRCASFTMPSTRVQRMRGDFTAMMYVCTDEATFHDHNFFVILDHKGRFPLLRFDLEYKPGYPDTKKVRASYRDSMGNLVELTSEDGYYRTGEPFHITFRKTAVGGGLVDVELWVNNRLSASAAGVLDIPSDEVAGVVRVGNNRVVSYWLDSIHLRSDAVDNEVIYDRTALLSTLPEPEPYEPEEPEDDGTGGSYLWDPITRTYEILRAAPRKSVTIPLMDGGALIPRGLVGSSLRYFMPSPSGEGHFNGMYTVESILSATEFTVRSEYTDGSGDTTDGAVIKLASSSSHGAYVYDPFGVSVTGKETTLAQKLSAGTSYHSIKVQDVATFDGEGFVVFGFGTDYETVCRYFYRPDSFTLLLDPSFVFPVSIPSGATVTQLQGKGAWEPARPELYNAFYLTDSTSARIAAENHVKKVVAAGTNLNMRVLYPGDRGLAGEGRGTSGQQISDKVLVWGRSDMDEERERARGL